MIIHCIDFSTALRLVVTSLSMKPHTNKSIIFPPFATPFADLGREVVFFNNAKNYIELVEIEVVKGGP